MSNKLTWWYLQIFTAAKKEEYKSQGEEQIRGTEKSKWRAKYRNREVEVDSKTASIKDRPWTWILEQRMRENHSL